MPSTRPPFTVTLFRHFGPTDFIADLGAAYWVDTMHFLNDGVSPIEEFAVDISDGTLAPDGSIKWTRVAGEVTDIPSMCAGIAPEMPPCGAR